LRLRRMRLRLCLRRGRKVRDKPEAASRDPAAPPRSLPPRGLASALCGWLAGPRGRLLRRAQIGLRRQVLEVGCGHGHVTAELARRCAGSVVAVDRDPAAAKRQSACYHLLAADAQALPFTAATFDLVFCQNVLMWVADLQTAIAECVRVLEPGGELVAIEPDYGGMMEYPENIALRDVWTSALIRARADPFVGRKLPVLCEAAGLEVQVELQNLPQPATPHAVDLLRDLPLAEHEMQIVESATELLTRKQRRWEAFIHVPYVLIVGRH